MSKSLPGKPSLEYLRKEAKGILRAHRKGDAAKMRSLTLLTKFSNSAEADILKTPVSLQEVQHALALDYGFAGWKELRDRIEPATAKAEVKQRQLSSTDEQWHEFLNLVVEKAKETYSSNGGKPVRIADLATGGGHGGLRWIAEKLLEAKVDFEFVFTDRLPGQLEHCYNRLFSKLSSELKAKLKFVLVDLRDSQKELERTIVWDEDGRNRHEVPISEVLANPRFECMAKEYEDGKRREKFADESFDILITTGGFGEMSGYIESVSREAARILRNGGWLIAEEGEVEKIRSYLRRAAYAVKNIFVDQFHHEPWGIGRAYEAVRGAFSGIARARHDGETKARIFNRLGALLDVQSISWATQKREKDDGLAYQTFQIGDLIRWYVAVYQKPEAK